MEEWKGWPKVKFESEMDPGFADEIASIPGGEKIFECIQCGTCSGMCPLSASMDYTPRHLIALIRAGSKAEVLGSRTMWLCASCYACAAECPKEIKLTDVMYAVKRLGIREGVYPRHFAIPVLAHEFFEIVQNSGRSTESWLLVRLFMKTNPLQFISQASLGLKLWLKGRLRLGRESVKRKGELRQILKALERQHTTKTKGNRIPTQKEVP